MYYILKDNEPVLVPMIEWAYWVNQGKHVIKHTYLSQADNENHMVSTMFQGLAAMPGRRPYFETRVFGGGFDGERTQDHSYTDAMNSHAKFVARVTGIMAN